MRINPIRRLHTHTDAIARINFINQCRTESLPHPAIVIRMNWLRSWVAQKDGTKARSSRTHSNHKKALCSRHDRERRSYFGRYHKINRSIRPSNLSRWGPATCLPSGYDAMSRGSLLVPQLRLHHYIVDDIRFAWRNQASSISLKTVCEFI